MITITTAEILRIVERVAAHFGVTVAEMQSPTRTHKITRARHVAMWCLKKEFELTAFELGAFFNRDHTTVCAALRCLAEEMSVDHQLAAEVDKVFCDAVAYRSQSTTTSNQIFMATIKKQYRQGDVLLKYVDSLPAKSKPVLRQQGRLILANGNSGHVHYIDDPRTEMVEDGDGARFLTVKGDAIKGRFEIVERKIINDKLLHVALQIPKLGVIAFSPNDIALKAKTATVDGFFALLRHDSNPLDHLPHALPRGTAAQIDQSEYSHEEVRRVTD